MDRINTESKAEDLFGAGKHGWKNGNIGLGIVPTDFNAEWCNGVQEELVGIIEGAGLAPDIATLTQVAEAIQIMIRRRSASVCSAAGTADVITGDFTPNVSALTDGLMLIAKATASNATTTPTFAADATAAKAIVKGANIALAVGDIAAAGFWMVLIFNAALDKWVMQNPATGIPAAAPGYLYVRDEKAVSVDGGSSVVGSQTRALNTVVSNNLPGVTVNIATGQITFTSPAANGSYRISARSPVFAVDGNRAVFYDVTAGVTTINGSTNNGLTGQNSDSFVKGPFSIAATKVFEVRHLCATPTAGNGLGQAANLGGLNEVYTEVEIFKVS